MAQDNSGSDTSSGLGVGRRSVLRALGAGSGVALASQGVYASGDSAKPGDGADDTATTGERCPPCIDPYAGYFRAGPEREDGQELGDIEPVATVDLRVTNANVVFPDDGPDGEGGPEESGDGRDGDRPADEPPADGGEEAEQPARENETDPGEGDPDGDGEGGPLAEFEGFPDFYFDPVGVHLRPGDVVAFRLREELHTVTAFHPRYNVPRRIPEGVPGFSSPPAVPDDVWYYRFAESGVYDVLCLPHLSLGMVMRVVVVDEAAEEVPEGYSDSDGDQEDGETTEGENGEEEIPPIAARVLNAPELDPENVVDQGTVAWGDLTDVESEPPMGPMPE